MSFKLANQLFRSGYLQEALSEYQKIDKSSPLYEHAQFNIGLITKREVMEPKTISNTVSHDTETRSGIADTFSPKSQPLVSVIMPVYNVAPYLDASIMSVINQTYQNIEVIIVNDASSDNGMNIIRMYESKDNRIKVINLEFNTLGGAGIPSNIGVDAAIGEYITYADSDDILDIEAIEKMVKSVLKEDAEVVIGDFCNFDNFTREIKQAYDKDRWAEIPLDIAFNPINHPEIFRISPVPWRKLYKRSYLNKYGIRFPEGDYFYEDNPLHWFTLASAERVVLIDEEIAYHRMEREGQTMGADFHKLSAQFCHLNSIRDYLQEQSDVPKVYWKELSDFAYRANWIVDKQDTEKVKNLVKKRYYQTANNINVTSGLTDAEIKELRSGYSKRLDEYNNAYPDMDLAIVIPVYNCADLLPELMNSLLKLSINNQVFLVDDGSTDGSTEICEKYASDHEHVFCFTQKNKGAGVARNTVIPLISAKYTYFVDADDEVFIDNLVEALRFAEQNQNDLVLFEYKIHWYDKNDYSGMWESDQKLWDQLLQAQSEDDKKIIASKMVNYPWIRIIKTELLHDENIFFGKTIVHNDVPYHWHSIVAAKNIGIFKKPVCSHRKFDQRQQITNIKDERRLAVLEAYRYTHELLKKYDSYPMLFDSWQKFSRDVINWAKDRIPEEHIEYYKKRQKEIVENLKKGI